jgi:C_GCAxxG_C_C family probable redox protein
MLSRADVAEKNFRNGYNCAQAVLSAFAEDFGLDEKTVLAIARGFGGGVGQSGGICGTVSGAAMVIGLSTAGIADNREGKQEAGDRVRAFLTRFEEKHGSILCSDLLGYSLAVPGEKSKDEELGLYDTICKRLVGDAARILDEQIVPI